MNSSTNQDYIETCGTSSNEQKTNDVQQCGDERRRKPFSNMAKSERERKKGST